MTIDQIGTCASETLSVLLYSLLPSCQQALQLVKGTEVRGMFQRSMEAEAAESLPELSKKAQQAFKGLTGATSKHDGLALRYRGLSGA